MKNLIFWATTFLILVTVPLGGCSFSAPTATPPETDLPLDLPTPFGTTATPRSALELPTVYPTPEETELYPDPEKRYDPDAPEFQLPPEMEETPAEVREAWVTFSFVPIEMSAGDATSCNAMETWIATGEDLNLPQVAIHFEDEGQIIVVSTAAYVDIGDLITVEVNVIELMEGGAVYLNGTVQDQPAQLEIMNCDGQLKMYIIILEERKTIG